MRARTRVLACLLDCVQILLSSEKENRFIFDLQKISETTVLQEAMELYLCTPYTSMNLRFRRKPRNLSAVRSRDLFDDLCADQIVSEPFVLEFVLSPSKAWDLSRREL